MKRRIPRKLKKEIHKLLICEFTPMTVTDTTVTQYFRIKIKDGEKINRWTYRARQSVRKIYPRKFWNGINAYYKSLKERRFVYQTALQHYDKKTPTETKEGTLQISIL